MTKSSLTRLRDIDNFGGLREELRLHSPLFGADLKGPWRGAELRWQEIQGDVRAPDTAVGRSLWSSAQPQARRLH